jgi:malate dehydrogenase (oxaloacetate-decarboxylating)(NADP+)
VFIADTAVHERPTAKQLASFATQGAAKARSMGHEPRVAFLSFANFGNPPNILGDTIREAMGILESRSADFEFEGEMTPEVALHPEFRALHPFCRLTGPANVLIMPGLYSGAISSKLLQHLCGATVIGPLLMGLEHPAQIARMNSSVSDMITHAALAAHDALQ